MVVNPTYPGVYVQEVASGVRTIAGVGTSTALFIGRASNGPLNEPVQCFSLADFERTFSMDTSMSLLPYYVRLFFLNGGTECFVVRIAQGATAATVTLQNLDGAEVLTLTAKQEGIAGENIRTVVTYAGQNPESTFNMDIFRRVIINGMPLSQEVEQFKNLTMNPNSLNYAPDVISQNSKLLNATPAPAMPAAEQGFSLSGTPIIYDGSNISNLITTLDGMIGQNGAGEGFNISVDSGAPVPIVIDDLDVSGFADETALATELESRINTTLTNNGQSGQVTVDILLSDEPDGTRIAPQPASNPAGDTSALIRITSTTSGAESSVRVTPRIPNDAAIPLGFGVGQGGLEVDGASVLRPAPNGLSYNISDPIGLRELMELPQDQLQTINLNAIDATGAEISVPIVTGLPASTDPLMEFGDGFRGALNVVSTAINQFQQANPRTFFYSASLNGSRLSIRRLSGESNGTATIFSTAPTDIASAFSNNVLHYTVGANGTGGFQTSAPAVASDGTAPLITDYDDAYEIVERDVDLFNLMVLAPDAEPAVPLADLYGPASVFCQQQRAFLIMDAPADWQSVQDATANIDTMRIGLVNDHAALFYPRITINDNGIRKNIGSAGAIAGLFARIDGSRGVWKAPAGTEAGLRGIVGVERRISDREQGALNPRAINSIRVFPNGIVNFGARTLDGDDDFASEYKYIPIRRLALNIEESLYRGLKWVVFEPNTEDLWGNIRLNVGAYMHGLFRRGAFQGTKPQDAYFVKCDSETTTQTDRNLGIVNIWVGFAPIKPAEFVILYLQQMTGEMTT